MLNAYSAMSPTNLKAVAEVVRIVGQLDRYHGFDAADWKRRLERARQTKPDEETATYGGALFCSAELALQDDEMESLDLLLEGGFGGLAGAGARPENLLQELESIDSAPEDLAALADMLRGAVARSPLADAATRSAVGRPRAFGSPPPGLRSGLRSGAREDGAEGVVEAAASDARPGNPPQDLGKVDSAPGLSAALEFLRGVIARSPEGDGTIQANVERPAAFGSPRPCGARDDGAEGLVEAPAGDARPENLPQDAEKVESAPELATRPLPVLASADLILTPGLLDLGASKDAPDGSNVAASWNMLRDATLHVAPQHEGGEFAAAAPGGGDRPENLLQDLENIDFAPEDLAALAEMLRGAVARSPLGGAATQRTVERPSAFGSPRPCGARDDGAEGSASDVPASGERPENLAQAVGKIESTPETLVTAAPFACHPRESGGPEAVKETLPAERLDLDARVREHDISCERQNESRPENLAQPLGKIESAPGLSGITNISELPGADVGPQGDAAIHESVERPAATGSPPPGLRSELRSGGRDDDANPRTLSAQPRRGVRPGNPAQGVEKIESTPEPVWREEAASIVGTGVGPAPLSPIAGAAPTRPGDVRWGTGFAS
jgi:hypothetical protein